MYLYVYGALGRHAATMCWYDIYFAFRIWFGTQDDALVRKTELLGRYPRFEWKSWGQARQAPLSTLSEMNSAYGVPYGGLRWPRTAQDTLGHSIEQRQPESDWSDWSE
jgi:hypothetical protein